MNLYIIKIYGYRLWIILLKCNNDNIAWQKEGERESNNEICKIKKVL